MVTHSITAEVSLHDCIRDHTNIKILFMTYEHIFYNEQQCTAMQLTGTDGTPCTMQHIEKGYQRNLSLTDNFPYCEKLARQ
jgi:hypothetical protein